MKQAKVVFQCAQPPYQNWDPLFLPFQEHIVSGVMAAGTRLVVTENLYMYGQVKGSMHEKLPYAAQTKKGRVRAEMSRKLLQLHQEGKLQVTMGRGSDFFWPGVHNSSAGTRIFKLIVKGKGCTVVRNPDKKHTYTYIDDFGKALVVLSDHEDAFGQAWHVPNAETVTTREFINLAYRLAGYPAGIRSMGKGMLRLGGLFIPEARGDRQLVAFSELYSA
jgi:nucleoside-diphosphate-sugar epimerase